MTAGPPDIADCLQKQKGILIFCPSKCNTNNSSSDRDNDQLTMSIAKDVVLNSLYNYRIFFTIRILFI